MDPCHHQLFAEKAIKIRNMQIMLNRDHRSLANLQVALSLYSSTAVPSQVQLQLQISQIQGSLARSTAVSYQIQYTGLYHIAYTSSANYKPQLGSLIDLYTALFCSSSDRLKTIGLCQFSGLTDYRWEPIHVQLYQYHYRQRVSTPVSVYMHACAQCKIACWRAQARHRSFIGFSTRGCRNRYRTD